jgi:hypothetical protein
MKYLYYALFAFVVVTVGSFVSFLCGYTVYHTIMLVYPLHEMAAGVGVVAGAMCAVALLVIGITYIIEDC